MTTLASLSSSDVTILVIYIALVAALCGLRARNLLEYKKKRGIVLAYLQHTQKYLLAVWLGGAMGLIILLPNISFFMDSPRLMYQLIYYSGCVLIVALILSSALTRPAMCENGLMLRSIRERSGFITWDKLVEWRRLSESQAQLIGHGELKYTLNHRPEQRAKVDAILTKHIGPKTRNIVHL